MLNAYTNIRAEGGRGGGGKAIWTKSKQKQIFFLYGFPYGASILELAKVAFLFLSALQTFKKLKLQK